MDQYRGNSRSEGSISTKGKQEKRKRGEYIRMGGIILINIIGLILINIFSITPKTIYTPLSNNSGYKEEDILDSQNKLQQSNGLLLLGNRLGEGIKNIGSRYREIGLGVSIISLYMVLWQMIKYNEN